MTERSWQYVEGLGGFFKLAPCRSAHTFGHVCSAGRIRARPAAPAFLRRLGLIDAGVTACRILAQVKEGDEAACKVDLARRLDVAANHTGTHILNFALRQALIRENDKNQFEKVDQKGSLVDEKMARFDFTWPSKLTEVRATPRTPKSCRMRSSERRRALPFVWVGGAGGASRQGHLIGHCEGQRPSCVKHVLGNICVVFTRLGGWVCEGGVWHKALVVGSVTLWRRLLASRP